MKLKTGQVNFQPGDRVRFKIVPQATGTNLPKVKVRLERKDESGTWTKWSDAFKVPLNQGYVIRKYVKQKRDLKVRARVLPGDRNYESVSSVSTVNYATGR